MNCRNSSTPNPRRTQAWLKSGLLGAALALFGTAHSQNVNVTATAGTPAATYATLNAAFGAINAGTHQGVIVCTVVANTTETAPATPLLASGGASSYSSILINCTGNVTVNSAATPTASRGIIELVGADNVTIDGDDPGTGGTRNLTFQMATTTTAGTHCIRLASNSTTGLDGANNNTVRNCNLVGGRSSATATTTSWGILMSNSTGVVTGAYSSLNTLIENNAITRCYTGIGAIGVSATYLNAGTIIRNNVLGSATSADNIGFRGININYSASTAGVGSAIIRNNDIRVGDYGATGYAASVAGIEVGTVNAGLIIDRNNIHDINQPSVSGYGAHGIWVSGISSGISVTNNFIRDCKMVVYQTSKTSSFIPCGVFFAAGATLVNFDHNTISMGTQLGAGVNFSSFAMNASVNGVTFASFRNNIIQNTHVSTNAYGFNTTATTNISGGTVNNNDYYVPGGHVGFYNAANQTALGAWQTATGKDGASISLAGPFVSATDLHANLADPNAPAFNGTGATGTGVTLDIDGDFRPSPPSIGADELSPVPTCSAAPTAGAITGSGSYCVGSSGNLLSLSGASTGPGISYQWRSSTTAGGPYGTTLGTSSTQNTGVLTSTTYFVVDVTCAGFGTSTTAEFTVTLNTLPTVLVDVPTANYCIGSPAIAITATGASTYAWGPAAGLNATTGATVNASPAVTTSYTVTGTDGNGCTNTATSAITVVGSNPTITSVSANPNPTCFNGNSQLQAIGTQAVPVSGMSFAQSSGTYTPNVGGTTILAAGTDDGNSPVTNIGFSFSFNGTVFTQFVANSNGSIRLGAAGPTSQYAPISTAGNTNAIAGAARDGRSGVNTLLTGAPGSRVLTIEYPDFQMSYLNGNNPLPFQIKLYEGTNAVQIVYGAGSAIDAYTAQVGLRGSATAGDVNTRTTTTDWNASTAGTETSTMSWGAAVAVPASGLTFTWTLPPPTYLWTPNTFLNFDNIANPLASGINVASQAYTVTATSAEGCTSQGMVTVITSAPISAATISGNLAICTGGSTMLTAVPTDGGGPYTYLWSPGGETTASITVNSPGSYSCQVTDNCGGSVNTGSVTVVENALPNVSVTPTSATYCAGSNAITLNASGASSYSWSPATGLNTTTGASVNAAPGATTTYTVTGTDGNGCQATASSTVTFGGQSPIIQSVTASPSTLCAGGTSNLAVVAGAATISAQGNAITINASGNASPYPGTINVSGVSGLIGSMSVTITNFSHTWPNDVDVVLFGPSGAHSILFTDAIGGSGGVTNRTYTFVVGAPVLPLSGFPVSGTYGVVNGDAYSGTGTPSAVSNTGLGVFSGTNPNGTWSLYVFDDVGGDAGSIGSWSLSFETGAAATSYSWSPATYLNNANIANPVATGVELPITYTVTASSATGCSSTGSVTLLPDNTDTDGDGIVDCVDDCPNVSGVQGSFCDADPNPNQFLLGQLDGNCTCQPAACTQVVTVEFQTDANGNQTSWEIATEGSNLVVCSGSGLPNNSVITSSCCLPDGCYVLTVFDSAGDGMTNGGYILRTFPDNQRIIDNRNNFSSGSVSAISGGQGFCLPMSSDRVIFTSCDKLDWVNNQFIVASPNAAVSALWIEGAPNSAQSTTTGYQFWFFDPNGSYSFRRFRNHATGDGFGNVGATRACHMQINNWGVENQIPTGVLMNVRVRSRVNGVNSEWGPACRFKIDPIAAQCPMTKLMDIPGNPNLSCGQYRNWGAGNYVHARPVSGASQYQFRFRLPAEGYEVVRTTSSYFAQLFWTVPPPLVAGSQYDVDVRAFKNGQWCPWGDVCTLNIGQAGMGQLQSMTTTDNAAEITLWPNPNNGDQLYLSLSEVPENVLSVSVDLFDLTGKRVMARMIPAQGGFLNTVIALNGELAAGLYLVNITAGNTLYTQRLVIQP
jgi:hypothetical protein